MIEYEPIAEGRLRPIGRVRKTLQQRTPRGFVRTQHRVEIPAHDPEPRRECLYQRLGLASSRAIAEETAQPPEAVFQMGGHDEQWLCADTYHRDHRRTRLPLSRQVDRSRLLQR